MGRSTMADESYEFEFLITFDGPQVPEWVWKKVGLYRGRMTPAAIEKLAGPAAASRSLRDRFNDVVGAAKIIAEAKVKAAEGALPEPVLVDVDDVV